jgi:hypothetical protein
MNNQNIAHDLKELYYTQVYSEGAFGSASMPAASSDAAKGAADKHRKAAETATSASDRRRHRDSAARYEVTARRMSMTADHYEFLTGYLIAENFASDLDSAYAIIENMSDEWMQSIFEQNLNEVRGLGKVLFRGLSNARNRGMRVDPETKSFYKETQLDDTIETLRTRIHQSNRGVKGAPIPANNPTIRNLEARRDKINQVRNTAK